MQHTTLHDIFSLSHPSSCVTAFVLCTDFVPCIPQVTYSTLIDGFVRAGSIDTGKELLSEMVAGGVKPNAVTYNTLIRAYAMDDKVDMQVCPCIATEVVQVRSFIAADCG